MFDRQLRFFMGWSYVFFSQTSEQTGKLEEYERICGSIATVIHSWRSQILPYVLLSFSLLITKQTVAVSLLPSNNIFLPPWVALTLSSNPTIMSIVFQRISFCNRPSVICQHFDNEHGNCLCSQDWSITVNAPSLTFHSVISQRCQCS